MTRETKLGLLIGTGIILLIGIVISDQLSVVGKNHGAPTAEYGMDTGAYDAANAMRSQQPALTGLDLAPTSGLASGSAPGYHPGRNSTASQAPMPGASIHIGEPTANPLTPSPTAQPYPANSHPQPQRLDPLPGAAMAQPYGNPAPAMNIQEQYPSPDPMPLAVGSTPTGSQLIGLFDPLPQAPMSRLDQSRNPGMMDHGNLTNTVNASPRKTVIVQAGDTLEGLARKYMGAGKHWPELLKANTDKLKKPQDLRPDMELVIPPVDSSINAGDVSPQTPVVGPRERSVATALNSPRTYTVQKGDTLYSIAQKQLGKASRWKDILQANKSLLNGDAEKLQPGMKLTLPAESSSASDSKPLLRSSAGGEVAIHRTSPDPTPAPVSSFEMPLLLDQPLDVHLAPVAKPIG